MPKRDRDSAKMRVTETGLEPVDGRAGEMLSAYPVGSEVEVTLHRKPNPSHRGLIFDIAEQVYPSTEFPTKDALMVELKRRLGHVDGWEKVDGTWLVVPRSLSTFDHDEMRDFMWASILEIETKIIPGLDVEEMMAEVYEDRDRRRRGR